MTSAGPHPTVRLGLDRQLVPSRAAVAALVIIGVAQAATVVASVLVLRLLVDRLHQGSGARAVLPLVAAFAGAGLVLAALRAIEYTLAERIGYRLVAGLRTTLHRHLLELPARAVTRSSQGAILLRFTGDLSTYRTWISRGLARGIASGCVLIGVVVAFTVIDWIIGLAVVATLMAGAAAAVLWGYQVRRTTRAVRWRRSLLASNVAEQIQRLAVVQTFGREQGEADRLARQNDDLLGALERAAGARGVLRFWTAAAGSLAVGAVLVVGVLELDRQRVTLGGVLAAMTAARLLVNPVRTLGRAYEYHQAAQVSRRKLEDFLARPRRTGWAETGERLRARRGRLEIESLSAGKVLHDIDLAIEPGELVAVVGDNGAGKSTLLAAIARQVDPSTGRIMVDGQDLASCSLKSTARNIGMVSPDLPLMRGTVWRNIAYRYRRASEEMVVRAVLDCRVDEVLGEIEGGLSGWVVEGGSNLSLGHRQRILLARATLGHPKVLLLDEPTANLDPATKEVFRRVLSRYPGTVLLVTHDPTEASLADRVVVMANGRVTRQLTGDQWRTEQADRRRVVAGRPVW